LAEPVKLAGRTGGPVIAPPVPDDILSAIGAVTVSFGLLEHQVGLLAGSMLGQPPLVCGAITSALSFRKLCGLVVDLAEMNFADDDARRQGFVELIKRARPLEEDRNRISHSLWGAGRTDGAVTRIKATPSRAKEGFHLKTEDHSAASLHEIANRMNVLSTDITNFLTAKRT
jgi:hypothetical protein